MFSLRIRHLMIVVVYVAVALAWGLAAPRYIGGKDGLGFAAMHLVFTPVVLACLSALLLRPGPYRDRITVGMITVACILVLFYATIPIFLLLYFQPALRTKVPELQTVPGVLNLLGLWSLSGACLLTVAIAWSRGLIRRDCPRCGCKKLLMAAFQDQRRQRSGHHYRCGVCDHEAEIPGSELGGGCPNCGRRTLIYKRHSFHWCLRCHARVKRFRHGPWEDAASPSDDGFYWLWTPAASLRWIGDRIRRNSRAEECEDEPSAQRPIRKGHG